MDLAVGRPVVPAQSNTTGLRMPTVQRANPHGERQIIRPLPLGQGEILDGDTAVLQLAGGQFGSGTSHSLRDGLRGAIDGQDAPLTHSPEYCSSSHSRSTTNLQNPHTRMHGQGFNHLGKSGRDPVCHGAEAGRVR